MHVIGSSGGLGVIDYLPCEHEFMSSNTPKKAIEDVRKSIQS